MAVKDTLGITRGARGVAHGCGGIFIKLRPVIVLGLTSNEALVVNRRLQLAGGVGSLAHNHVELHCGQLIRDLLQQRYQVAINKNDLVFGVVDDVDQLVGKQADIEGVQDSTHAGNSEIEFKVAVGVPGKGGNTITLGNSGVVQCMSELHTAFPPLAVGVTMYASVGLGDDLFTGEDTRNTVEKMLQCQWVVHYQALHRFLLSKTIEVHVQIW